jgi:hypothetical protein
MGEASLHDVPNVGLASEQNENSKPLFPQAVAWAGFIDSPSGRGTLTSPMIAPLIAPLGLVGRWLRAQAHEKIAG